MKIIKFLSCMHAMLLLIVCSSYSVAQYDSISFEGLNRTFLLHLPNSYTKHTLYPLVIAMHGGLGSALNIQNQSQLSAKADTEGFIVVYPEGIKGGELDVRTWNAGWCCGFASDSNINDVGFISALMDTLIRRYSVDTTRIYATGMSNGGFMAYRLACELSQRIAAIAPVAASMSLTNCRPAWAMPIIHFHSYLDSTIPYDGGVGNGLTDHYNIAVDTLLNEWAYVNNCGILNDTITNNSQYTHIKWASCNCNTEMHCYVTQDGGHSWPGGVQTIIGDSVSKYLNATDLMWSFFKEHTLVCQTASMNKIYNNRSSLRLYPNPTAGIIHIDVELFPYFINVYNNIGQKILTAENKETIDLTGLTNGIYYVSVRTKGNLVVNKIIKNVCK